MRVLMPPSLVFLALALLPHASCTSPGGGGGGVTAYPDGWVAPDTGGVYVPPAYGPPVQAQQYCDQFGQITCAAGLKCGCLDFVSGNVELCKAYLGAEFEEIVVLTRPDGTRLLLRDIARVVDGFQEEEVSARFNGEPAVLISVYRVGNQKVLDLVDRALGIDDTKINHRINLNRNVIP